jgi:hypothetical protein
LLYREREGRRGERGIKVYGMFQKKAPPAISVPKVNNKFIKLSIRRERKEG